MKHNHLAIWVMVIVNQALGFVWYTFLFSKMWQDAQPGRDWTNMDHGDPMPFVLDIIGTIFMCYFISWLVQKLNYNSAGGGVMLGVYISLGILIKAIAGHYGFLGLSNTVLVIDQAYTIVAVILTCAVLAGWRKKAVVVAE